VAVAGANWVTLARIGYCHILLAHFFSCRLESGLAVAKFCGRAATPLYPAQPFSLLSCILGHPQKVPLQWQQFAKRAATPLGFGQLRFNVNFDAAT